MRNTTLNIRTTHENKHLLQEAANIIGTTVSGFVLNSANQKAQEILQNQNHFVLDDDRWNMLCERLDQTPTRNKALKKLFSSKGVFDSD